MSKSTHVSFLFLSYYRQVFLLQIYYSTDYSLQYIHERSGVQPKSSSLKINERIKFRGACFHPNSPRPLLTIWSHNLSWRASVNLGLWGRNSFKIQTNAENRVCRMSFHLVTIMCMFFSNFEHLKQKLIRHSFICGDKEDVNSVPVCVSCG